jgi:tRNA-specific 2-thiouridylase
MKFELLQEYAWQLGCEAVVTGHYARIIHDEKGWHLYKALDPEKDQSYVLYNLTQETLPHTMFPLGGGIIQRR